MNVEKVSKWLKGSLRIHTLLDLGGTWGLLAENSSEKLWKTVKMMKSILVTEFSVGPWGSSDENCTYKC
jgi:hypothetical protein